MENPKIERVCNYCCISSPEFNAKAFADSIEAKGVIAETAFE